MKRHIALLCTLALLVFGLPQAIAIIVISGDFPMSQVSTGAGQANSESQLSQLVGLYENDVALLINPEENYSEIIKETTPNPAAETELRERAAEKGNLQALADAVGEMVAVSPENAHTIVASAIAMLSDIPGGDSPANRMALAKAALVAIPQGVDKGPTFAALVIGVTARDQKASEVAQTVMGLREYAIGGVPDDKKIASTTALDGAMVYEGILRAVSATPDFVNLARAYSTARTFPVEGFSGDQGVINTGGTGGFGGSGGGGGNNDNNPTPTPTPTPAPTPAS